MRSKVNATIAAVLALAAFCHIAGSQAPSNVAADTHPRLFYGETVSDMTTIWSLDPVAQDAQRIYEFKHPDGWDGRFALSPDGTRIAFNRVAEVIANEVSRAELFMLYIPTIAARKLDGDSFLYATPVWDQNSRTIVYESVTSDDRSMPATTVRSIDTVDGTRAVLFVDDATLILPIGFASTGQLLYYRAAPGTHSLMAYDAKTQSRQLVQDLTADRPRDFSLSPDRNRVLFRAQSTQQAETEAVQYLDIEQGRRTTVAKERGELPTPTWSANGQSVEIGGHPLRREWNISGVGTVQTRAPVSIGEYPAPDGIELPVAQSLNGRYDFIRYHTTTADYYGVFDRRTNKWHWLDNRGSVQWIGWAQQ